MRDLINWSETDEKKVVTVCPIAHQVAKSTLVVDSTTNRPGRDAQGKTNPSALCLKGYGWDFINDTQILTRA